MEGSKNHTAAQDNLELGILSLWSAGTLGMYVPPHPRSTGFFKVPIKLLSSGPRGVRSELTVLGLGAGRGALCSCFWLGGQDSA